MVPESGLVVVAAVEELAVAVGTVLPEFMTALSRACSSGSDVALLFESVVLASKEEVRFELRLTLSDADPPPLNRDEIAVDSTLATSICVSCPGVAVFSCWAVMFDGTKPFAESELELIDIGPSLLTYRLRATETLAEFLVAFRCRRDYGSIKPVSRASQTTLGSTRSGDGLTYRIMYRHSPRNSKP